MTNLLSALIAALAKSEIPFLVMEDELSIQIQIKSVSNPNSPENLKVSIHLHSQAMGTFAITDFQCRPVRANIRATYISQPFLVQGVSNCVAFIVDAIYLNS